MAKLPSKKEVQEILKQNQQDHDSKAESQKAQGKSFIIPADGHGPGVVPETIWQAGKATPGPQTKTEAES